MSLHPPQQLNGTPFRGHDAAEIAAKRAARVESLRRDAPRYVGTFQRAYKGDSLRAAVNAFCAECVGFESGEVRACTAVCCPLWSCRPGRGGA